MTARQQSNIAPRGKSLVILAILAWGLIGFAVVLPAGCGGGDEPIDGKQTITPPNCAASAGVCT